MHTNFPTDKPTFDIALLTEDASTEPLVDEERLVKKAQSIKDKLAEFNIDVDIEGFNVGPTVVQFKISPQSGIKISKIESYTKDIALALRVKSLRVLAPIPGTASVGIEIPNPKPQMVRLREVLGGLEFTKSMQDNLTNMTIGK
jgi:S-DNA-T family DNA segregation ATPase FtsK/SpoIIIE